LAKLPFKGPATVGFGLFPPHLKKEADPAYKMLLAFGHETNDRVKNFNHYCCFHSYKTLKTNIIKSVNKTIKSLN